MAVMLFLASSGGQFICMLRSANNILSEDKIQIQIWNIAFDASFMLVCVRKQCDKRLEKKIKIKEFHAIMVMPAALSSP